MSEAASGGGDDPYTVRPFEPADREAFLALYREVFDTERSAAWLDWKYAANPHVDGTPIVVAERDGDLVGARPFFALPMRTPGGDVLALQPADAMVHADHRRRGLFTRMTRAAIERHRTGEPAFYFNFPNPKSLPGNLKLGWSVVGELPTRYRVQDPGALLDAGPGGVGRLVGSPLTAAASAYQSVRERLATTPGDVTVTRHRSVPGETLAALYEELAPTGLHAARDEAFYRWRFGDAPTTYVTYVAERGGTARCAVVVTGGAYRGERVRRVVDVAPMGADTDAWGARRRGAARAALLAVLEDSRDCAAVVTPSTALPRTATSKLGFHDRDGPVLSRVTEPTRLVARSLDDGEDGPSQTVGGVDLTDAERWRVSFAERDNC